MQTRRPSTLLQKSSLFAAILLCGLFAQGCNRLPIVSDWFPGDRPYFPPDSGPWKTIAPAEAGWNEAALGRALDYAGEQRSSGVVVLVGGRVMAERNWDVAPAAGEAAGRYERLVSGKTEDGRAREDIASAQKSIVSFLAGVAAGEAGGEGAGGALDIESPAVRYLGTGWSAEEIELEARITVRHLMSMTSGLTNRLGFGAPAGSRWRYNTAAYSRMVGVLEEVSGSDINATTSKWLTSRIGMNESRWEPRPWADPESANAIGFVTTARDLARFGLLILSEGSWKGRDLLRNPGYLVESLSPSQDLNPAYGFLWWLNGQSNFLRGSEPEPIQGSLIPTAPDDLVAAQGALGRKCFVVPSLDLVVTRLGDAPGKGFNREFWRLLMEAAPTD